MLSPLNASAEHKHRIANAVALAVSTVEIDPRSVELARFSGVDALGIGEPDDARRQAIRDYFVAGYGRARCTESRRAPDRLPEPVSLFNRYASDQVKAIRAEEIRSYSDAGDVEIVDFWSSTRSRYVLALLQSLNTGGRTLEERSTKEWNAKYLELLRAMEDWKPDEGASFTDYFNMKANTYQVLAEKVAPGRAPDNAVDTLLSFLSASYASVDDPMQWFFPASRLLNAKDAERAYYLAAMRNCSSPVLALYAEIAVTLTQPGEPASRPKSTG